MADAAVRVRVDVAAARPGYAGRIATVARRHPGNQILYLRVDDAEEGMTYRTSLRVDAFDPVLAASIGKIAGCGLDVVRPKIR